jgi:molybdate transport system ATP-binding protein
MIEKGISGKSSARNRLPGSVREIRMMGPVAKVKVDCGFPIMALVTRQAVQALGLEAGARVTAVVKATAVHLIPCGPSRDQRAAGVPERSLDDDRSSY